ncbi:hypothetical protein BDD26_1604 [Xenorhabdus cabanillasii]|uniref:Uncharacterized protein n=1 Tax=Xenorhabdus cabanillasii TaxID=351673 RepID=A0A3D9UBL7_9GAMM|nr:hypothetical protein [Xenorhabdus cabanillasii]REF26898.1 hypothetical protein BDD26_1604 [Xenorhabdus cabanillasii]
MIFRSKSFSISRPAQFNPLNCSQSSLNLISMSFDARASLVSEKVSLPKACEIARHIIFQIENEKCKFELNKKERRDVELRKWDDRCVYSSGVFQSIQERKNELLNNDISQQEKFHCFATNFRGYPVGVLIISITNEELLNAPKLSPDVPLISDFSIHPGIRGAGITLIECTVNLPYQLGKNGVVQLTPID